MRQDSKQTKFQAENGPHRLQFDTSPAATPEEQAMFCGPLQYWHLETVVMQFWPDSTAGQWFVRTYSVFGEPGDRADIMRKILKAFWKAEKPDLVITFLHPEEHRCLPDVHASGFKSIPPTLVGDVQGLKGLGPFYGWRLCN